MTAISSSPQPKPQAGQSHKWLLPAIGVSIVLGAVVGGFFPEIASNFKFLGDAFLNALKMIVVPLVILSIIMGIAGMGDLGAVDSMGWRTVAYYFTTTAFAVLLGIILVNVVRPGTGVPQGELYPGIVYSLSGDGSRTVTLDGEEWQKSQYDSGYELVLTDQNIRGVISSYEDGAVTVNSWRPLDDDGITYVPTEDGAIGVTVDESGNTLVVADLDLATVGAGVQINRTLSENVRGSQDRGVGATLAELVVGSSERQGLIPRNIFDAMVNTELLPLISFALLLGIALTSLGVQGQPAIRGISSLNDAVMKVVQWIVMLAPIGIFGIIADRFGRAGGFIGFLPELAAVVWYSLTVILAGYSWLRRLAPDSLADWQAQPHHVFSGNANRVAECLRYSFKFGNLAPHNGMCYRGK
jgi:hypothetical protein